MITQKIPQYKIVEATNASEFEKRVNSVVLDLAKYSPEVERLEVHPFLCVIKYSVTEQIAETVRDECHLNGERFCCGDCPNFVVPDDKRMKCRCALHGYRVSDGDDACEERYEEMAKQIGRLMERRSSEEVSKDIPLVV